MQVKTQIKASILLGLFSLLLLHQSIPHIHHDHQQKHEHRIAKHSHSHEHEHKHGHEEEHKDSKGFFSILLAMHSHGGSSPDVPVVEETIQHINFKKLNSESSSPNDFWLRSNLSEFADVELKTNYQPPPKLLDSHLAILSLRGPPRFV